jgi:hypothetical protein
MTAFSRTRLVLPMVSLLAAASLSAQAQEPEHHGPGGPAPRGAPAARPAPAPGHPAGPVGGHPGGPVAGHPGGPAGFHAAGPGHPGPVVGRGPDARFMHGAIAAHSFGGHPYRGRMGWEGGRWRHEVHDGRNGWWWDVGGVWYYYPQPMEGPPAYVSEDFADDVVYAPDAAYDPGPPPPVAYEPAPPPPDPGASAVGGAIVGGVLGGLLTGRASGAAAGAVIGGATGAIAGATAASRPGYYLAQGNCYYRYPSGQYVAADPRACY